MTATKLEVVLCPAEFAAMRERDLSGTVCVVFDVLRATTSMVSALANGAEAIIPVGEISEALAIRQERPEVLLAGEREGLRIRGNLTGGVEFDLGNSPREFTAEKVQGRTIVMTTTNGTRALRACDGARAVLVSCFLNLRATYLWLLEQRPTNLILVCSGTFDGLSSLRAGTARVGRRGRTLIHKRWMVTALLVAMASSARPAELKDLYPDAAPPELTPAREVVSRAFENLFGFSSITSIVHLRTGPDGQVARSEFRVLRRLSEGTRRTLTESLSPAEIEGTRVLQIDRPDGSQENYAFVRTLNREPFRTQYRMADPFLCTWYEGVTSPGQAALRAQSEFEVLSRRMDELDGELVHRVLIRPMSSRGFDRVELAIAARDYAILEYRNYLEPRDVEPALIARTARVAMVAMAGHLLPTRMRYEDRATDSKIDVELSHAPLPPQMPAAMFEPRSFHRVRIDGTIEEEPAEPGQNPNP